MLDNFAALYVAALQEEGPVGAARDALTAWLRGVFWNHRTFMIEIPLAFLSLAVGAWLLNPDWESFRPGAYQLVRRFPEWFWGCVFIGHGLHYCASLIAASFRREWAVRSCLADATIACLLWGTFAVDFFVNVPSSIGGVVFSFPWFLSLICWMRLAIVARKSGGRVTP